MNISFLPILIASISTPDTIISPEGAGGADKESVLEIAMELAACSGKYSALAEYSIKEKHRKLVIDNYNGMSGGARVASAYMFHSVKKESKRIESYNKYIDPIAGSNKKLLKQNLADPPIPFKQILSVEMARCTELNPLQTRIINKLQKDYYSGGSN